MHVKAKKAALGGLLLAVTVICMVLGSVMETSTLFLLAAASYFVGIIIREMGIKTGIAFYIAAVLLGFIVSPNKFYVISFAAMGFYILAIEVAFKQIGKMKGNKKLIFWFTKYLIFNLEYLPLVFAFQELLFGKEIPTVMLVVVILAGQIGLFVYDRAYEYFQGQVWNKMRGKVL